jgi:REP-associated tyrosine transposase
MGWLNELLPSQGSKRDEKWSTSVAVGGRKFVTKIKELLGARAIGRRVTNVKGTSELREPMASYNGDFIPEMGILSLENMYYWQINSENTMG